MLRRVEYAVRLERGRTRRVAEQKALEVSIHETEPDKACIRQIAEQRRQHELAQSLLTQHSLALQLLDGLSCLNFDLALPIQLSVATG